MAKILNLNKARKTAARRGQEAKAVENRVKFGRAKAQKTALAKDAEAVTRRLDDRKLDR